MASHHGLRTIIHECVHAAEHIVRVCGSEKFGSAPREVLAETVELLFGQVLRGTLDAGFRVGGYPPDDRPPKKNRNR